MVDFKKDFKDIIVEITDKSGKETIFWADDFPRWNGESFSSGSAAVDSAVGVGGIPRGKITQIYGPASGGKTTLCLQTISSAQKQAKNSVCAFIDVEHALDLDYAVDLGVKTGSLLLVKPRTAEEALAAAEILINDNRTALVVLDSIAALYSEKQLKKSLDEASIATRAKLLTDFFARMRPVVANNNVALLMINQIRANINAYANAPQTIVPGGKALEHSSDIILEVRRIGSVKKGVDEVTGNTTQVIVKKNRLAPPMKKAVFEIIFGEGVVLEREILHTASALGIIKKKGGGHYSFRDQKLGQGDDNASKFLKENAKILNEISDLIKEEHKKIK